jgi:hypothetical protein
MYRALAPLALALLLALAGCNVPETSPDEDVVSVSLTNEADRTHDVWITIAAEPFEAVEITYRNGSTRRVPVESLDQLDAGRFDGATNLTILADRVQRQRFALEPDTGIGKTYTDVPADPTVVYFSRVRGDDAVRNVGVATCGAGPGVTDLRLTVRPDGSYSVETTCTERSPSSESPA